MKFHRIAVALIIAGLVGCATTKEEPSVPFNQDQINALFKKARPPQIFGLTVYNSDAGPVFAGGNRIHQGDIARMSMMGDSKSTAPVVLLDGRTELKLPALIDTCSRESWVTPEAADKLGIAMLSGPPPYQSEAAHVYDEVVGAAGLVQKIVLSGSHVENVVFNMRMASGPLGPLSRWISKPAPVAVLGMSLLRAFSFIQFDFAERTVVLSSSGRFPVPSAETLLAKLPIKDVYGVPAVEGSLDGDPVTLLLDIAGDYELVMNEPAAETVRRLSIGDLVFPPDVNVVASMDQGMGVITYPRVGRKLLSRYKVSFDFRGKQVYFERPAPAVE